MKKVFNLILIGLSLSLIEYFILFLFLETEGLILYSVPVEIFKGAVKDATEITILRFVFYFLLWVVIMFLLWNNINIKYPFLKLALLNCGLYIALSILMTLFFPFATEYFRRWRCSQSVAAALSPTSGLSYLKNNRLNNNFTSMCNNPKLVNALIKFSRRKKLRLVILSVSYE